MEIKYYDSITAAHAAHCSESYSKLCKGLRKGPVTVNGCIITRLADGRIAVEFEKLKPKKAYQICGSVAKACKTLQEDGIRVNGPKVLRDVRENGFAVVDDYFIERMEDGTVELIFVEPTGSQPTPCQQQQACPTSGGNEVDVDDDYVGNHIDPETKVDQLVNVLKLVKSGCDLKTLSDEAKKLPIDQLLQVYVALCESQMQDRQSTPCQQQQACYVPTSTMKEYKADWYTIYDYGFGDVVVVVKKGRKKFMLPAWIGPYAFEQPNAYKFKWNNLTQSSPRMEKLVVPEVDGTYIMSSHDIPEYARHLISHTDFPPEFSYLRAGRLYKASYVFEEVRFPLKKKSLERLCDFYGKLATNNEMCDKQSKTEQQSTPCQQQQACYVPTSTEGYKEVLRVISECTDLSQLLEIRNKSIDRFHDVVEEQKKKVPTLVRYSDFLVNLGGDSPWRCEWTPITVSIDTHIATFGSLPDDAMVTIPNNEFGRLVREDISTKDMFTGISDAEKQDIISGFKNDEHYRELMYLVANSVLETLEDTILKGFKDYDWEDEASSGEFFLQIRLPEDDVLEDSVIFEFPHCSYQRECTEYEYESSEINARLG